MDESKARMQFIYMFGRSGGVTVAAIKKEGEYIGKRFIFNDDSFADVYFQAPQKLFFGKHIEGGNQVKAIEGLQKED